MKITILTVGKIKEKYWKDAIAEYAKATQPVLQAGNCGSGRRKNA